MKLLCRLVFVYYVFVGCRWKSGENEYDRVDYWNYHMNGYALILMFMVSYFKDKKIKPSEFVIIKQRGSFIYHQMTDRGGFYFMMVKWLLSVCDTNGIINFYPKVACCTYNILRILIAKGW